MEVNMKILIIFGSIEGQTGKIAQVIAQDLTAWGHEVLIKDTDAPDQIRFAGVDAVVLAGSVHERRHPKNFEASLIAHQEELAARKTLLLSISLNAAFPEGRAEALEYVTDMTMRTKLSPDQTVLVAGAVRSAQYDYFATQVLRHVVLRDHPAEAAQGPHEFTDWAALLSDVAAFLETCKGQA